MPRRLLSAAAASVLVLCSLAACGDKTGETITDPPPDLGIESPSDGGGQEPSDGGRDGAEPTADAPDIPAPDPADFAGMDQNTPEGAEQAFRYYIAVSIWAHQTGDSSSLAALDGPDCVGCKYLNDDIQPSVENDLLWSPSPITDYHISFVEGEKYSYEVRYLFTLGPHTRADSSFNSRIEVDDLQYDTVGGMNWVEGKWIVDGMSIEWGEDVHDPAE